MDILVGYFLDMLGDLGIFQRISFFGYLLILPKKYPESPKDIHIYPWISFQPPTNPANKISYDLRWGELPNVVVVVGGVRACANVSE